MMSEALEPRFLMSASAAGGYLLTSVEHSATAMLVPAVQAAREVSKPAGAQPAVLEGPECLVFYLG